MHRPACWRTALSSVPRVSHGASRTAGRRFKSSFVTRTAAKSTGTLVRWGLAGAAVYYYNTSNVFADEPRYATAHPTDNSETYSSIDAIAEQRRAQAKQSPSVVATTPQSDEQAPSPLDSPEGLEEEAQQQGAFNEETGEINWDCPCLGGMAHGPCGEQFKAAFSCFVFSKEEPKGIDCIEHFKTMQNCFREYPEIYGAELTDDGEDGDFAVDEPAQPGPAHAVDVARESINDTVEKTADAIRGDASQVTQAVTAAVPETKETAAPARTRPVRKTASKLPTSTNEDMAEGELVPRQWHNSTADNEGKTQK